jgi:hypothetical protein
MRQSDEFTQRLHARFLRELQRIAHGERRQRVRDVVQPGDLHLGHREELAPAVHQRNVLAQRQRVVIAADIRAQREREHARRTMRHGLHQRVVEVDHAASQFWKMRAFDDAYSLTDS